MRVLSWPLAAAPAGRGLKTGPAPGRRLSAARMPPLWKAVVSSTPPCGVELPAESVAPVPSRTWLCDSRAFKRLQAAGRSSLVISPVGLLASIMCGPPPQPQPPHGSAHRWPCLLPSSLLLPCSYTTANVTDLTYTAFIVALSVAFNDNGARFTAAAACLLLLCSHPAGALLALLASSRCCFRMLQLAYLTDKQCTLSSRSLHSSLACLPHPTPSPSPPHFARCAQA